MKARIVKMSYLETAQTGRGKGGSSNQLAMNVRSGGGSDGKKKCEFCNKAGHDVSSCWAKGGGKPGGSKKPGHKDKSGGGKKFGKCNNCGKEGHWKRECKKAGGGAAEGTAAAGVASGEMQEFAGVTICMATSHVETAIAAASINVMTMDGGATSSLFSNPACFDTLQTVTEYVRNANNQSVPMVRGVGTARYKIQTDSGIMAMIVCENAKWAPGCWTLQSESQLKKQGHGFSNLPGEPYIWHLPNGAKVTAKNIGGIYQVPYEPAGRGGFQCENRGFVGVACGEEDPTTIALLAGATKAKPSTIWHERLAHTGLKDCCKIAKVTTGMVVKGSNDILGRDDDEELDDVLDDGHRCEVCALSKQRKHSRSREAADHHKAQRPMERVFVDVNVMPIRSMDNFKYVMTMVDDFSNAPFVDFLALKSDAVTVLGRFEAKYLSVGKIDQWRADNDSTITGTEMEAYLNMRAEQSELGKRSHLEYTIPGNSYMNGRAENAIKVLTSMTRCLMKHANFCKAMWVPCMRAAAYIRRLTLTERDGREMTLHERFFGWKPDLSHMRVFGCRVYVRLNVQGTKLDDRSKIGILVGYEDDITAGYHVFIPAARKAYRSADVDFDETLFLGITAVSLDLSNSTSRQTSPICWSWSTSTSTWTADWMSTWTPYTTKRRWARSRRETRSRCPRASGSPRRMMWDPRPTRRPWPATSHGCGDRRSTRRCTTTR